MIKTLFKHIIAETAINTFFDKVTDNFMAVHLSKFKYGVGEKFIIINTQFTIGDNKWMYTYCNCEILDHDVRGLHIKYESGMSVLYINGFMSGTYKLGMGSDVISENDIRWIRAV